MKCPKILVKVLNVYIFLVTLYEIGWTGKEMSDYYKANTNYKLIKLDPA